MKKYQKVCLAAVMALGASASQAAQPKGIDALLQHLVALHDGCASMAQKASDKYGEDQFDSAYSLKTAQSKASIDAQVYAVGHGSRETRDFYLAELQSASERQADNDKKTAAEYARAGDAVKACVHSAEADGKHDYSEFKAQKGIKLSARTEAEALMTAWLANLDEISTNTPQGSSVTAEQWKTAKAHAELSTL